MISESIARGSVEISDMSDFLPRTWSTTFDQPHSSLQTPSIARGAKTPKHNRQSTNKFQRATIKTVTNSKATLSMMSSGLSFGILLICLSIDDWCLEFQIGRFAACFNQTCLETR